MPKRLCEPVGHQNVQGHKNGREKLARPLGENYSASEKFSILVSADQLNQSTRKRERITAECQETTASSEHSNISPGQTSQTDQSKNRWIEENEVNLSYFLYGFYLKKNVDMHLLYHIENIYILFNSFLISRNEWILVVCILLSGFSIKHFEFFLTCRWTQSSKTFARKFLLDNPLSNPF